ncbi:unnamed protein product [Fusarium graminearum]|uniref:Chromosome 1, complete genome n=2 Tax=Gibberella zeae TaxID=5518 RepID=I1RAT0_GIBZE|nr:hypothetical protein FGSG_00616 [Fusarium graminearum PH-1]EYB28302.1 hypothetical protein FG05_00616 [Fusarium graminearum]ESU05822.1 hypothetical protein FGSG_00616 [Fusarium graminearum PH-1]KAI6761603.1 hypothetical protein HG531_002156 [Fusarium graminearum]PCD18493.1 hypothetical protein FGRA07_07130 [Fusarium graminearum]CAF3449634.1 unnamed protein product [Fusarium graminearum]|eukprot:XP_011316307.1 hypothetical protein FGSG_00616 [Fusarium graminearum PH-1]
MGQGDGLTALDSRLRSSEGYWPNPGTPTESTDSNSMMSLRDSGSLFNQGPGALDDIMSFLDSETLDSCPESLSHRLHPRPLHHYTNQPNHAKGRVHAESSHAHAYDIQNMHSQLERQKPPLQPQRQRRVPTKLDTSDFAHHVDQDQDQNQDQGLGDLSFLLPSRPMSIATTAMTTTTMDNGFEPYPPPARPGREQIELRVPPDARLGRDSLRYNSQQYCLSAIDTECLFPDDSLSTSDRRPSSSRSHLVQWRRTPSVKSDSNKHPRASSDLQPPTSDNRPSTTITREEFESLPPTIQRKYFSTIERSQLAHSPDLGRHQRSGSVGQDQLLTPWSSLPRPPRRSYEPQERPITSDASLQHLDRPRIASTDQQFYANLPEKIKRRHLTDEELLFAYQAQETRSEATEELPDKTDLEWQSQDIMLQSPIPSPRLSGRRPSYSSMLPRQNDKAGKSSETTRPDSFYDSFRWLDDEEGLDLRLYLDDYHINLREEVPVPNKSRRPSFRRHLSINKLPFGRPSMTCDRLAQEEIIHSPTAVAPPVSRSSVVGPFGHSRKKSRARALSLISANRQSMISPLQSPIDPAATHYQDPEARKKLRECLASPQKFDEAIEFGFFSDAGSRPQTGVFSKSTVHQQDRLRSFLEDDRSSKYSDDASAAEPDSPKTPQLFDRPHHIRSVRNSIEHSSHSRMDKYMPDTMASREMTLRMTLTRPDLRQSEDQIYGWKQGSSHAGSGHNEPASSPAIYARGGNPKQSIERQLSALDQWEDHQEHDSGAVKRLWNRVKRS